MRFRAAITPSPTIGFAWRSPARRIPINARSIINQMRLTRRGFARMAAGALTLPLGPPFARSETAPLFVEVPPDKSGIVWTHNNAMSPDRHLPETMGPGVAFIDYDNDGWMDIFLVNSGESDFFKPEKPLRNALYK